MQGDASIRLVQAENRPLPVPRIFRKVATHFLVTPERIASALVYKFCLYPPRGITFVQRQKGGAA